MRCFMGSFLFSKYGNSSYVRLDCLLFMSFSIYTLVIDLPQYSFNCLDYINIHVVLDSSILLLGKPQLDAWVIKSTFSSKLDTELLTLLDLSISLLGTVSIYR